MHIPRSPNPAFSLDPRNTATEVNPSEPAVEHLSENGSSWLWAVTSVYIFVLLIFMGWNMFLKHGTRLYHQLAIVSSTPLSSTSLPRLCAGRSRGYTGTLEGGGRHSRASKR